jgi:cell division transport system ATP-binding protein
LGKRVSTLSGGERQRVAILRAFTRKVDLLIADEPTGAQDFEMTWKLMDLFVKLNLSGTALLLATHDLEMVRRLRKRCAILKDGGFKVEDRV